MVQNQLAVHGLAMPILLPKLTSAAIMVSSTAGDVLACIDAPVLRDLHLVIYSPIITLTSALLGLHPLLGFLLYPSPCFTSPYPPSTFLHSAR